MCIRDSVRRWTRRSLDSSPAIQIWIFRKCTERNQCDLSFRRMEWPGKCLFKAKTRKFSQMVGLRVWDWNHSMDRGWDRVFRSSNSRGGDHWGAIPIWLVQLLVIYQVELPGFNRHLISACDARFQTYSDWRRQDDCVVLPYCRSHQCIRPDQV